MSPRQPPRTARRVRATIVVLLGVSLALVGVRGYESSPSSASIVASHADPPRTASHTSLAEPGPTSSSTTATTVITLENPERGSTASSPGELGAVQSDRRTVAGRGAFGDADGVVPNGTTIFDDDLPGITKLDPALLDAVRRAATDAASEGVHVVVNSGWRSAAFQDQMHREAVAQHGSEAEASRWVATAGTSAHVTGDAVDIAPSTARTWLSDRGAEYGLCQIYSNEPWHFELRPEAIHGGCPAMYPDATHDPRMQQ